MDGFEQVSIHDMDWTIPTAVIFGNEHLYVPSITQIIVSSLAEFIFYSFDIGERKAELKETSNTL